MTPSPSPIPFDEDETYREMVEILRDIAVAEAEAARGAILSPAEVEASLRAEGLL